MKSSKRTLEIKAGENVPYEQIARNLIWELKLLTRSWDESTDFKCNNDVEIHIIKKRSSED